MYPSSLDVDSLIFSRIRAASQEDHQRIFAAIMARDAAGARDAMRAHLSRVIEEFTQAWR